MQMVKLANRMVYITIANYKCVRALFVHAWNRRADLGFQVAYSIDTT